jgi:quercetin dioxygenase-like cupin family protein
VRSLETEETAVKLFRSRKALGLGAIALGAVAIGVPLAIAATSQLLNTTDVRLRVVTGEFADGFDSGWHTHPGPVIVQVQEGAFKMYQNGCEPTVVQKGETFVEIPYVPIRAVAKGYIKWTTSQVLDAAGAFQTNVASPCD